MEDVPKLNRELIHGWLEDHNWSVGRLTAECNLMSEDTFSEGTVRPITSVVCDYMLCEYVSGDAKNSDIEENLSVAWVGSERLDRIIPREQIFRPIREALGIA